MEQILWNGVTMAPSPAFPLGTDAVLLAHFADVPGGARVADLGSGSGALGLMLCASHRDLTVTGVELDPLAHAGALENIRRNHLEHRLQSILADVRQIRSLLPPGSFQCVVTNPPYFKEGSGKVSRAAALARSEEHLPLEDLCQAAAWLLPWGGRLFLVHRPERLCDLFCTLRQAGLEPKRLRLVRHQQGSAPCFVLIEARRGGKPGLRLEPDLIEFDPDGNPTGDYLAAYHRGETP